MFGRTFQQNEQSYQLPVGMSGALALGRTIAAMLYGVKTYDAPTFMAAAMVLIVVAFGGELDSGAPRGVRRSDASGEARVVYALRLSRVMILLIDLTSEQLKSNESSSKMVAPTL